MKFLLFSLTLNKCNALSDVGLLNSIPVSISFNKYPNFLKTLAKVFNLYFRPKVEAHEALSIQTILPNRLLLAAKE